jgi:hypothetical protein
VNPNYPEVDLQRRELREAGAVIKRQIHVVSAGRERDIDAAFTTFVRQKTDALLVANDPFFLSRRDQIVALAARHAIPAIYSPLVELPVPVLDSVLANPPAGFGRIEEQALRDLRWQVHVLADEIPGEGTGGTSFAPVRLPTKVIGIA